MVKTKASELLAKMNEAMEMPQAADMSIEQLNVAKSDVTSRLQWRPVLRFCRRFSLPLRLENQFFCV